MRVLLLGALLLGGCSSGSELAMTENTVPSANDAPAPITDAERRASDAVHRRELVRGTLHQCRFDAYSIDPQGLNVRATPSADAAILAKLPAYSPDPELGRDTGPVATVLEARNGWFRIRSSAGRKELEGWVSGKMLDFDLQTDFAYAEPRPDSRVVAAAWDTKGGERRFTWRHPSDCKGKWVKLRVTGQDGIERDGWAAGVCANQDTSCDGVYGTWGG